MYQNGQISMKTFELEDQYAIIFSLALWPQEPHEIHFFKKTGFHKKCSFENVKKCQNWDEMGPGWRWRAQIWSIWVENELIKRFKTLPGPGEAIFDQKWPKRTKIGQKKNPKFLPYDFPYFSKGSALGAAYLI